MKSLAYESDIAYDEMFLASGVPRPRLELVAKRLQSLRDGQLERTQRAAESMLRNMGITFAVYGHTDGTEKVWPFDILPRVIEWEEWQTIERDSSSAFALSICS